MQRHLGQSEFRIFVYHWLRALAMLDGAFDVIAIVPWIRKFIMPADFFDEGNKKTHISLLNLKLIYKKMTLDIDLSYKNTDRRKWYMWNKNSFAYFITMQNIAPSSWPCSLHFAVL